MESSLNMHIRTETCFSKNLTLGRPTYDSNPFCCHLLVFFFKYMLNKVELLYEGRQRTISKLLNRRHHFTIQA